MGKMFSRLRLVLLVTFLGVLTSGCLQYKAEIDVNADGSGSLALELRVDRSALGAFGGGATDCEALLKELNAETESFPDGKEEVFEDGDWCVQRLSTSFANPEEFLKLMEADDGSFLRSTADGGWELSLGGVSEVAGDATDGTDPADALSSGLEISFSVTMPGEIVEHNGSSVDGSTVIWNTETLLSSGLTVLSVRSGPGSSGSSGFSVPVWLIAGLGAVVLLGVFGAVFARRRSSQPAWAPSPAHGGWGQRPSNPGFSQPQSSHPHLGGHHPGSWPNQAPAQAPYPSYPPAPQPPPPYQQPYPGQVHDPQIPPAPSGALPPPPGASAPVLDPATGLYTSYTPDGRVWVYDPGTNSWSPR